MSADPAQSAPKVSVLLPVYNAAAYLAEAVESILSQSFTDFEFLILDDGSTDGSPDILAKYARQDPRIRLVTRENRGLIQTLNELGGMARGTYLARMDADDISLPERFGLQVARLEAEPDLSVLGTYWTCVDEARFPIFTPRPPLEHEEIDALNLFGVAAFAHPTVMMRAEHFHEVGGYDTRFEAAEDMDLWLRMGERGRLANLEKPLLHYRMLETSISGTRREDQLSSTREASAAARRRRGLPPGEIDEGEWRPGTDRHSRTQFALSWGWRAWKAGNQTTARRFFYKALKISPLSFNVWRALIRGGMRPR